jgi:hypothetical protein
LATSRTVGLPAYAEAADNNVKQAAKAALRVNERIMAVLRLSVGAYRDPAYANLFDREIVTSAQNFVKMLYS